MQTLPASRPGHDFTVGAARVRTNAPLSNDQMIRTAPSIFAVAPHESRSARYAYIPTVSVLDALRAEGFLPYEVSQAGCRIEGTQNFTKHMIRLRHADAGNVVGGEFMEVVLVNSHNGTSAYQMSAGMFRLVCSNGLVCSVGSSDGVRIPHTGDVRNKVVEGAYEILNSFQQVAEQRDEMQALQLTAGEREVFARAALAVKYDEAETIPTTFVSQVVAPKRRDDAGADLWSTFNVAQEHLVNGGMRNRTATGRRIRTRPVQGIGENVKLNRALWMLADGMRQLKAEGFTVAHR